MYLRCANSLQFSAGLSLSPTARLDCVECCSQIPVVNLISKSRPPSTPALFLPSICVIVASLVWRSAVSSNGVRHINEVKLRRARFGLGLVITSGGPIPSRYFPGHSGPLSLAVPLWVCAVKKRRVPRGYRLCDQDCWHTSTG